MTSTHHHGSHHDAGGHRGHGHGHGGAGSHGGQAEILDLDAEVLAEHTASIIGWLPLEREPRRIVDLGCGTGAGTFALLERFPDTHVTAVDASAEHLQALRANACARGVDSRVWTVQADLDADDWPDLGTPDLVWASASMHHMAHPSRALAAVLDLLAPDGLFAVVELAGMPRFLPVDAPADRPGLEERAHAAADGLHAGSLPHRGADWGPMLTAAGFTVAAERTISVAVDASVHPAVGRYAHGTLQRVRHAVASALDSEDLAALDGLLDPDGAHSILRRDDLVLRTERTVWAARRA